MRRRPTGVPSGHEAAVGSRAGRTLRALLLLLLSAGPAVAQDSIPIPPSRSPDLGTGQGGGAGGSAATAMATGAVATADGGVIRVLDKIDGTVKDLDLRSGETATVGSLTITMGECRYPADNPAGDAYTLLSIRTAKDESAVFEGWMIASAPALNALDHPRYDVWALRCRGVAGPSGD